MSKSTKVIAALGVAAGLGVAALPAATFAATTAVVDLKAVVPDSLSIAASTTGDFAEDHNEEEHTFAGLSIQAGAYEGDAAKTDLTIKSNKTGGWVVTVAGSGSGTNATSLYSGDDEIATLGTTKDTQLANHAETSGWGLKLADNSATDALATGSAFTKTGYRGVGNNSQVLYSANPAGNNVGMTGSVIYGIQISDSQNVGTYEGQITYTVANNN